MSPGNCWLVTLGCKVNLYESEALTTQLQTAGFSISAREEEGTIFIVNSCAVTAQAEAKTRQAVRRLRREHPRSLIVLMGCFSDASPLSAAGLGADLILNNNQKPHLAEYLQCRISQAMTIGEAEESNLVTACTGDKAFSSDCQPSEVIRESWIDFSSGSDTPSRTYPGYNLYNPSGHTRPLIKIQDGCNNRCTYCLIPSLRGPERSRPLHEVVREAEHLRDLGYAELVLCGIHLSRWGRDFDPEQSLADLLGRLLEVSDLPRIRLSSVEPTDIDKQLIDLLARANSKICPHLHIPLQSGCDETLKRMGRRYLTSDYRALLAQIRQTIPDIALTTDLIAGFPGENEAEFRDSLAFCEEMAFARLHIFRYSPRQGTVAQTLPGRITRRVQEERSSVLQALGRRLAQGYAQQFI
ncbi:MAG: tRNA (N(6)-L-threonylcarbamoyladenosine(37)-C(2))-methylthiotransferase MtaB, partial [Symbiobacteriaceae bacterium]|nr:tRNA (N(6)-L-threonylcarbamoyladenosine(37)-C(2))-methylthiotransferase MtaB [Symbiobacteriaceae bacterium]